MDELLSAIDEHFDEAEGWIRIVDADWYADDLRVTLSVKMHDDDHPQLWEVECLETVEELISSYGSEALLLTANSQRLYPYKAERFDIFFSKNECIPGELLGILTSICAKIFGNITYLHRFLNLKPDVDGIVSETSGKLGNFPKPVMEELVVKLKEYPIVLSVISTGNPKKWNGNEFKEYPSLKSFEIWTSQTLLDTK
ncbi:hypothetical protein [Thalassotalea castellviae]|uniref:Uncharacterized protein n=1 Tax=Thalassotalea castellviae TaxID=3075612 RepID=A0ABU2ZWN7_9GAMM|nr:hypothetical protein [Thalassotalea sp. W431]MDT0602350.1 hypothetical protein [Thalassotalea sp. W431]